MQNKLQNMRIFACVANAKSFTAAAHRLNTTIPQVSRAVAALEAYLQTRLLNRTTRRIVSTEAGERYLQRCQAILVLIDEAEAEAREASINPSGWLRVHCMVSLGQHYLVPAVAKYRQRYPEVQIELTLSQRTPGLVDEGLDVSVLVGGDLPNSSLVGVRLGETFGVLCASPAYLAKHGTPRCLADLVTHSYVTSDAASAGSGEWELVGPDGKANVSVTAAPFRVNTYEAMAVAIREGMGIGILPVYSVIDAMRAGDIVRVMPEYRSSKRTISALYSSRHYIDAKIRTWLDFLRDEIGAAQRIEQEAFRPFDPLNDPNANGTPSPADKPV
ncbi:LysR family transcriptional regulator [Burkholderia sp. 22PA0099]|uniref:LysR family transcriptional regulator n=1 Tax=Burkholderia sp. 22PA0099 TaxID=3237372 RepID=UPI0039C23664